MAGLYERQIMKVGTAQVNITPEPGIELAGFAIRDQPSTRVLDPLWVRVLYLEDAGEKVLWIHGDVLAFDEKIVRQLRDWIQQELGIPSERVIIAATHTHSGPATIQLVGCGKLDAAYVNWMVGKFREAVVAAVKNPEPCRPVFTEGHCQLGIDRVNHSFKHTDTRVGAIGWRRDDGSFKAAVLSYSMHPVCLRDTVVSGDWPGETARFLSATLPGSPVVIVSSGACGNVNPPEVGVTADQTYKWGRQVAQSVVSRLLNEPSEPATDGEFDLRMRTVTIKLPLESWSVCGIERHATTCLADASGHREFGVKFAEAIENWRVNMLQQLARGRPPEVQVELGILSLGCVTMLTVNAEVFSRFNELVNSKSVGPVYTVGCANGMLGYLASLDARLSNGYEVSWSMFFYNKPKLPAGGLERVAQEAIGFVAERQPPSCRLT